MATILLLQDNDWKENSAIGGNVDPQRVNHCIRDAQKQYLVDLLSKPLYQKMMADYGPGYTGIYDEIYEYVYDFLVHKTAELYYAIGSYMISNAGITKTLTEETTTVNANEVDKLVVHQRNMANRDARKLTKFLNENKASIPEYKIRSCSSQHGDNIAGMYFPKRNGGRNDWRF